MTDDLPWWHKATVGFLGGLSLALLKPIDARFYIGAASTVEAHAAYLTYFAYMLLGGLAAVFLADHDLPPKKILRSAFVIGILAPSVLLAIANQPFRPTPLNHWGETISRSLKYRYSRYPPPMRRSRRYGLLPGQHVRE